MKLVKGRPENIENRFILHSWRKGLYRLSGLQIVRRIRVHRILNGAVKAIQPT